MKKAFALGSIVGLIFLCVSSANAQTTQTSENTVDVETNTNGTTHTHIEANVNGNNHVYDSDQPGSMHIENNGTSYSVETSSQSASEVQRSFTPTPASQVTTSPKNAQEFSIQAFFQQILDDLKKFLIS